MSGSGEKAVDNSSSIQRYDDSITTFSRALGRSFEISTQTELQPEPETEGGGMIGAIFILMNAVLGAGILEFPYTFATAGLITAFEILAFLLLCAMITHLVLAKSVDRTGATNYYELVGLVCGNKVRVCTQLCLFFYTSCSCIAYMVTIGDQLTEVCYCLSDSTEQDHEFYCDRHFVIPVSCLLIIFPLIWFKTISAFSYVSFFSVISVFYLVAAVVSQYITSGKRSDTNPWYPAGAADPIKIVGIMPALSFAYQCHMTSVPLYGEMRQRSTTKYLVVVGVAMFLASLSYVIVGLAGMAMFGSEVKPDVILNFPADSILITIGRVAVTVSICMTYPVILFIGRQALEGLIITLTASSSRPLLPGNTVFRVLSIICWFFISLVVATFATQLNDVISIAGSFAATFMFVFPGCIIAVFAWQERNYAHIVVGAVFLTLGVFIFVLNIVNTIDEHLKGHPKGLSLAPLP